MFVSRSNPLPLRALRVLRGERPLSLPRSIKRQDTHPKALPQDSINHPRPNGPGRTSYEDSFHKKRMGKVSTTKGTKLACRRHGARRGEMEIGYRRACQDCAPGRERRAEPTQLNCCLTRSSPPAQPQHQSPTPQQLFHKEHHTPPALLTTASRFSEVPSFTSKNYKTQMGSMWAGA